MADWRNTLPSAPEAWPEYLLGMPRSEASKFARDALEAWVDGTLEPVLLTTPHDIEALCALRHQLVATFSSLRAAGFDTQIDTCNVNPDEATARRWCWVEDWVLLEQDEDLMLMGEHLIVPLLDEAKARCPKRDYVISIVAHGIRDAAHAALAEGADAVREHLAATSKWVPHARRAKALELAAYCERLASYAVVTKVDAEGARARGSDLTMCEPGEQLDVRRLEDTWLVDISSLEPRTDALIIQVGSGRLWREDWPKGAQ